MPQRRSSLVLQPQVHLTLEPELFKLVDKYHQACGQDRTTAETLRELLWIAITSSPITGTFAAARQIALRRTQQFVMQRVSKTFNDLAHELFTLASEAEKNGFAEAQLAAQSVEQDVG